MEIRIQGVNHVKKRLKGGGVSHHYYWRETNTKIEGEPGTPKFWQSLEDAKVASEVAKGGTFGTIIDAYLKSPDFRNKADNTRRLYNSYIPVIRKEFGNTALATFNNKKIKGEVLDFRDNLAYKTPCTSEAVISLMKVLCRFGDDRGYLNFNHLQGLKKANKAASHADMIWDSAQIRKLLNVASEPLIWAVKLALLTGQRQGDLIRFRWSDWNRGHISFTQTKTGAYVEIPVFGALEALLNSIPRKADAILTNAYGRSWGLDGSGLRDAWGKAMRDSGLEKSGLRFHDLRGTAVTVLADMGCTEAQIASITGHSLEHVGRILKSYLKRTSAQAHAAMKALDSSWIGQLQTELQTLAVSA